MTESPTRIASARAMRLSTRPSGRSSSGLWRSMKNPAPPSAASTSTRNATITIFMKNDYSTDTSAPGPGSPGPDNATALPADSSPMPNTRSRIVWFLVALACALLTARLGLWQLSRAHQKVAAAALIAERGGLAALPAEALARDATTAADQWQRRIVLQGHWDAAHTVFLMNRTMDERAGFFAMTPLRLPSGDAVVVQRGWLARATTPTR